MKNFFVGSFLLDDFDLDSAQTTTGFELRLSTHWIEK